MKTMLRVLLLALCAFQASAQTLPTALPHGSEHALRAAHWIARWPSAENVLMTESAALEQNARLLKAEPSMTNLWALPASVPATEIRARIETLSTVPSAPRYFANGRAANDADHRRWRNALHLRAIRDQTPLRFALVVQRAALRAFPTDERVFAEPNQTDLDRFQESALFPGAPVAVLHTSADGHWVFVLSENYAAWMKAEHIALTDRDTALGFAARASRTITGAQARLTTTPEAPELSGLLLDMGTALPERTDWPAENAVNGQGALGSYVVELPSRTENGELRLRPALLPRGADSNHGPLAASRANVLRQAFKFLGERYGWGHDFNARDCSGFVAEIYRSIGLKLPRNTSAQAISPVFARTAIPADWTHAQRLAAVTALAPGDLLYMPGHVVMLVGFDERGPWVIHDSNRIRLRGQNGLLELPSNGVAVMPLLPLQFDDTRDYLGAITAIQRILPAEQIAP